MKELFNTWIDVFEERFNHIIDMIALVGSIFAILVSFYLFFIILLGGGGDIGFLDVIIPPGVFGFFAILMLFALRLTRHFTKEKDE